jgi:hypothetical protein
MPTPVTRAYLARVEDVSARDRSIVAKINTGSVDRYRTVIDPRGIDFAKYRANPVVLWEHGRDFARGAMPVGRNEWIKPAIGPNGPELIAKTVMHAGKKGDDFTDRLFECYKDGDMRAFSVNVIPDEKKSSPPSEEEKRENPSLEDCVMCYRASELAEYSLVAVGGNAEALTLDEARSILRCQGRGIALPVDLVQRAEAVAQEDEEEGERTIVEEAGKWLVYSAKGKKVGEFETEEDAVNCKKAKGNGRGGHGGKDLAEKDEETKRSNTLPPLTGRSLADVESEYIAQIRSMFDSSSIADDLKAHADLARGVV